MYLAGELPHRASRRQGAARKRVAFPGTPDSGLRHQGAPYGVGCGESVDVPSEAASRPTSPQPSVVAGDVVVVGNESESLSTRHSSNAHGDTRRLIFFDANTRHRQNRHLLAVGASKLRHAPTHLR